MANASKYNDPSFLSTLSGDLQNLLLYYPKVTIIDDYAQHLEQKVLLLLNPVSGLTTFFAALWGKHTTKCISGKPWTSETSAAWTNGAGWCGWSGGGWTTTPPSTATSILWGIQQIAYVAPGSLAANAGFKADSATSYVAPDSTHTTGFTNNFVLGNVKSTTQQTAIVSDQPIFALIQELWSSYPAISQPIVAPPVSFPTTLPTEFYDTSLGFALTNCDATTNKCYVSVDCTLTPTPPVCRTSTSTATGTSTATATVTTAVFSSKTDSTDASLKMYGPSGTLVTEVINQPNSGLFQIDQPNFALFQLDYKKNIATIVRLYLTPADAKGKTSWSNGADLPITSYTIRSIISSTGTTSPSSANLKTDVRTLLTGDVSRLKFVLYQRIFDGKTSSLDSRYLLFINQYLGYSFSQLFTSKLGLVSTYCPTILYKATGGKADLAGLKATDGRLSFFMIANNFPSFSDACSTLSYYPATAPAGTTADWTAMKTELSSMAP